MLEPLQSEPFLTYAAVGVGTVVLGSHGIIYLLSIVGLLLRPFWHQPVAFFYPWVRLTAESPDDIAKTPFKPSRLLLIHALWLVNSVGLWVGYTLYALVGAINEIFPDVVGLDVYDLHGLRMPAWIGFTVLAIYVGMFASLSSWMWVRSLRRSLAHYRRMYDVRDSGSLEDPGHYLAPFRKTAAWAVMTLPISIGLLVLVVLVFPPWQG